MAMINITAMVINMAMLSLHPDNRKAPAASAAHSRSLLSACDKRYVGVHLADPGFGDLGIQQVLVVAGRLDPCLQLVFGTGVIPSHVLEANRAPRLHAAL